MSRIKELRASLDQNLDVLECQALALEAQLTQTKDQALQRLEQCKQQLRDVLAKVLAEVQKSTEVAAYTRSEVQGKIQQLHVQLAGGKAEAGRAFEEQRAKILRALSQLETTADEKLTGAAYESGRVWEDLVVLASSLEAEFEALRGRFEIEKAEPHATLDEKKQEVLVMLQAFQRDLKAKRQGAQANGEVVARDLRQGLDQAQTAFRKLFE